MKSNKKFVTVIAMCLAFVFAFGIALVFKADKKVYAEESYFMAVEKYNLPIRNDGVPDLESIIDNYGGTYEQIFIYDSVNGNKPIGNDFSQITADNWTNVFVSINENVDVNIVDFLRELTKLEDSGIELIQTLATNDVTIETYDIAMLRQTDGYKEFITISFLPNGLHAKLSVDADKTDSSKTIYNWSYIGTNKNFQTLTVNASLNDISIKAQTQYQSLTSDKKYYTFATDLSNIEGADESNPYIKYNAQGHYSFEFSFTDQNGAGSSLKPTIEFWALDEQYYKNNSEINNQAVAPKLWNVKVTQKRANDETNTYDRNKKELSIFGYNNGLTSGNNKQDDFSNTILYPTATYDPTRYTLSYYFVDRSLDSGALEIVTSELQYVDGKLMVVLSNGKSFEVTPLADNIVNGYTNKMYQVDVVLEDLGNYVLQFDFALNKIENQTMTNWLPSAATKVDNALERSENWNKVRDEQFEIVGTDDLTIFGYQLFYSVYGENGNDIAELKNVENNLYADVTNANKDNLQITENAQSYQNVPTTNQPPLFFRYGENQSLSSIVFNRYDKKGGTLKETKQVDNIYRFASTGRENFDNGYYEVFVNYEYAGTPFTQIFAFEVKYTSPKIDFSTIESDDNIYDWTGIGYTNKKVKIDWSSSLTNQSPFDIAPNVKINATEETTKNAIIEKNNDKGFANLSIKDNTFATFIVTIEWGPINANRPSKTYTFTIDKTQIADFVELVYQNNNSNDELFDGLITNNAVRVVYGQDLSLTEEPNYQKDSGAKISMTYSLLQMNAGESVALANADAIKNGYKIASMLENNAYEPYTNGEKNYLPNVNAIFVLNFADDAGNTYTKYLIEDNTSPKMMYRIADENGKFANEEGYVDNGEGDWKELTDQNNNIKTDAQVNYGKYKAILINESIYQNVKDLTTNADAFIQKIDDNYYLLVKIDNKNVQYEKIEAKVGNEGPKNFEIKDIVGNQSNGRLVVNFDNISLAGILTGNYPNNIQNIGNIDNYAERKQDGQEIDLATGDFATKQYLKLKWEVLGQNYVVEKIEYEYYPFDLNSNPAENENYPFANTSTQTEVLYKANEAEYADINGETQNINTSTGNKEFSGGNATKQGLYVITRTYNHEQFENAVLTKTQNGQTEKDTEVRKYYYFIDRNNIITLLNGSSAPLTSPISIMMGSAGDQSTFGGSRFLEDILDANGNVLTTNKQSITINIPTQKYKVSGVTFEGFDYTYNDNNNDYDKIEYKLFFMPNERQSYSNGLVIINGTTNGTYRQIGTSISIQFDGKTINAAIPNGSDIGDKDCTNLNFEIDDKQIYAKRYTQNMLYYQFAINSSKFVSATDISTVNNANGATNTNYSYLVCVSDISNDFVGGNSASEYVFENNKYNSLVFKFEAGLSKPTAWWQDAAGFETSNNQNDNNIKLVWNKYTSEDTDYFANIDNNDIKVQKQIFANGQIQTINLGTFAANSGQDNAYISVREIENSQTSAKYQLVLKYINANNYYEFGSVEKIYNLDKDKPYYNYSLLFYGDAFLQQLSSEEIAGFEDYTKDINFENYAFVVNEDWALKIPTATDVYDSKSRISYDKLFVSETDEFDYYDISEAWYRQYDKQYFGTNPEHLQSIVPGDLRYYESAVANYKFDANLTDENNNKIYSKYEFGNTTLQDGKYYEIIEKDIAGNYRVYTIYVTSENARTIDFELADGFAIEKMADDATYIVKQSTDANSAINIAEKTELNSLVNSPLVIKSIDGLGEYYDVTIKNLATNGSFVTLRRTKSADIVSQINSAIYNNFSYDKNGNNFEISFFTASGTYVVNYRTESELSVLFNSSTSTLTFSVDKNVGSYIKSLQVLQDGTSIYNIGETDTNKPFTLTITRTNQKTTYMLRFDLAQNYGTQIKYTYVDNFGNQVKDFKVIGIENTNFDFDPNDTTGSNMLVFGDGTGTSKNYDQIDNQEGIATNEFAEFTHVSEFYTGANTVTFRYQTKVYSNVKIYKFEENSLAPTQIKNLPSYTSNTTFKNTTQIYSNNDENVNVTYLITFVDPVGNIYEYIIHHYTLLAEISFECESYVDEQDSKEISFDGQTIPQLTDPIFMYVSNQPEEYPTIITATRRYISNGYYQTENLGTIKSGYIFNKTGTYTVSASNGIGLVKTFVFGYTETDYSLYTVTATSQDGIARVLKPNENIKYSYNGNAIDQYFALKSEAINISYGKNYTLTPEASDGNTTIYTIQSTKTSYSKTFAITQIKATTDLLIGRMFVDEKTVAANAISVESTNKVVTLTIPDYYGDASNKLVVSAKFNGRDLGVITGTQSQDGYYRTYNFDVAGDYIISISDQAGNVHLFNGTTQNFALSVLNNVMYRINGKEPIKNSYYNDTVVLNVINIKKFYADKNQPYVTEVVKLNNNVLDSNKYSKVDNGTYYTYTFSDYGSYSVTLTAYVGSVAEQNKVETTATFTIINQNQARNVHEYIGLNGYQITSIIKDNVDITNQIRQKTGNAILNQFALVGGTGDNIVGGNGRYTITVKAYLGSLVDYEEFTYNVWLNDDTSALIETSIAPGSATTKTIYLKMNLYQIYSKIGECKIKLNGKTYVTINADTASENKISTYGLTTNQTYNVTVETDNGNTLLSFVVTKKEPLNTVAIIVIVAVSLVGTALAVTFVLLRKKMKVR